MSSGRCLSCPVPSLSSYIIICHISLVDSVLCLILWLYFAGRFCSLSYFVVVFRWSILFFVLFCGCISLVDSVLCLLLWLYFAGRFCSLSYFVVVFRWSILFFVFFLFFAGRFLFFAFVSASRFVCLFFRCWSVLLLGSC